MILNEDSCTGRRPFRDNAHTPQSIHTPSRDDQCSGFAGETNSDIFRRKKFQICVFAGKKVPFSGTLCKSAKQHKECPILEVRFSQEYRYKEVERGVVF